MIFPDLAFVAQKKLDPKKIIGLDLSNGMLNVGGYKWNIIKKTRSI